MKRITKIEANQQLQKKLRVAAYARVSTDSREQLISLEAQRSHYETCIKSNPNWEYVGLYYDEGVSGTRMAKRDGDELGMEIRRLREEKQTIQAEDASRQDRKKRIDELIAFLEDLPCELTEYDEQFVKTLIEKITVFDNHFIVEFKSGIEIEINE